MNEKKAYRVLVVMVLAVFLNGCQKDKAPNIKDTIKDNNVIAKEEDSKLKSEEPHINTDKDQNDKKNDNNETNSKQVDKEPDDNKEEDNKLDKKIRENPWKEEGNSKKIANIEINNKKTSWWFIRNKTHTTPRINGDLKYKLSDYDAHYVGDTNRKVLYLTFDEGYEKGYTASILDTLKDNNVKATFFVTLPYINSDPNLVKRMVNEGHAVGNHTKKHLSMPDITSNKKTFETELTSVANKFKEVTGKEISPYFRPPMGHYSEKSLAMTKNLGYKSIFWSFAYHDWDPADQPKHEYAKDMILGGLHNGSIVLLHAVSKTNTEILDYLIKEAKKQGYEFELLP